MDLKHRFSVPAPLDEAWKAFNNLEALAPCFPGATIANVEGDDFAGSVKIKLGPISLLYNGSGRYLERNNEARRVVIEARGKDKRGNGTATAMVTASFTENGPQTDVEVLTDLAITGKPAQFGRGVISDVSDKLLEQFVSCVSGRLGEGLAAASEVATNHEAAMDKTAHDQVDSAAGLADMSVAAEFDHSDTERTIELEAVPAAEASTGQPVSAAQPKAAPSPVGRASEPSSSATSSEEVQESTLNVLSTIGPVILKRYGPALAVFGLLLFIVIKIIRRKS
jgi:carbon monoxide dehydrogenase subunit G